MFEETSADRRLSAETVDGGAKATSELCMMFDGNIGQRGVVEPVPQKFDRVEVWCIRRQPFHMEPVSVAPEGLSDFSASVSWQAVPQQDNPLAPMAARALKRRCLWSLVKSLCNCAGRHKTRNVLGKVRRPDQQAVKKDLHRISHARNIHTAQTAALLFVAKWQRLYPKATACLVRDLPQLLTFLRERLGSPATALRTTNAIERRFREVRRRTRLMGSFSDHTSIDRIMFAVLSYETKKKERQPHFC